MAGPRQIEVVAEDELVHDALLTSEPDLEVPTSEPPQMASHRGWRLTKMGAVALSLGTALLLGCAFTKTSNPCSNAMALEEKVELDAESQMNAVTAKLNAVTSRSTADKMVARAMQQAGKEMAATWDKKQAKEHVKFGKLPDDLVQKVKSHNRDQTAKNLAKAGTAQCIFNVGEATSAVVGLGLDINAMIRTCPAPRGGESELACQVDGGILVAWIGLAAAKLSLAASNCAETANIDAICAAGVSGLVFALGQLAATASLASATCTATPPTLSTSKISELGDQTLSKSRRLLIGEGTIGNGIQCGVDVSIAAENIANMGLAINSAVNAPNCHKSSLDSRLNKKTGLSSALCTVDIGGAIAYFSEVVTFINLAVVHCQDFLDVKALCGASIAGIITAAAAIAPYGSAVHAACRYNSLAKSPEEQAAINGGTDGFRRLLENAAGSLQESTSPTNMSMSEADASSHADMSMSEADVKELLHLMEPALGEESRGGGAGRPWWPFHSECTP